MNKMAAMLIYGKTLKTLPGTTGQILMKLCMKHQRPTLLYICVNYDPGLTLIYSTARSNFASKGNVTSMYSLEIIASCDLKFG